MFRLSRLFLLLFPVYVCYVFQTTSTWLHGSLLFARILDEELTLCLQILDLMPGIATG